MPKNNSIVARAKKKIAASHEVVELRTKTAQLEEKLAQEQIEGTFKFDRKLARPSKQVRQTITTKAVKEKARSLKEEGQANPILLIPLKDDPNYDYEIEDGELTWRGSGFLVEEGNLEWSFLEGKLSSLSPNEDAHTKSFLHHRHQESLNPLDDVEALFKEIVKVINWEGIEAASTPEKINLEIKRLIGSVVTYQKKNEGFISLYESLLEKTKVEGQELLQDIELEDNAKIVVLQLARWLERNIHSLYTHKVPLIFLSPLLKSAIRDSENPLSVGHVIAISRVEDVSTCKDLIEQCKAQNWSLKDLKGAIKDIPSNTNSSQPKTKNKAKITFREQKSFLGRINQDSIKNIKPEQARILAKQYRDLAELFETKAKGGS